jgi:hypothetical protein
MQPRSTLVLAAVAIALAGVVVGFLLERWVDPLNERDRSSIDRAARAQDITPVLSNLQRAVEELTSALHSRAPPETETQSSRAPVVSSAHELDRLTAAVEKLNEALAAGAGRTAAGRAAADAWKGKGVASRQALAQRVNNAVASNPDDFENQIIKEMTTDHFGWTIQEVFERYGAPTEITPEAGYLDLHYRLSDDPADPSTMGFRCVEGLVTFVWHRG